MNLLEAFNEYDQCMKIIGENRSTIKNKQVRNRDVKKKVSDLKDQIVMMVDAELGKGKTMYQICKDAFGTIDRRHKTITRLFDLSRK